MKPYHALLLICTALILYACQQTPTPTNVVSPTSSHTLVITPTPTPTFLTYTVQPEETIFSIAERFGLRAETILWANQTQLHDNPHRLKAGMVLRIPPVDGCFYIWQSGDTLEQVAQTYGVNIEDIVNWAANGLDPQNPAASLAPGKELFIPGGRPPFGQVTFPTPATPQP
ncbi:MAG: LysM peptidoglycan-binding domain-containing protein [Thermanaerothrix sp.]|uniref:LysM peptidoglycan-binding domain-containing protein n=1 Tax=Thermanaerothrix sp. TaxID=2972675 RepID=UPI003C7C07DB